MLIKIQVGHLGYQKGPKHFTISSSRIIVTAQRCPFPSVKRTVISQLQ